MHALKNPSPRHMLLLHFCRGDLFSTIFFWLNIYTINTHVKMERKKRIQDQGRLRTKKL